MEEASGNGVEERQVVEAKQEDEIIDIATDTRDECEVADAQANAAKTSRESRLLLVVSMIWRRQTNDQGRKANRAPWNL